MQAAVAMVQQRRERMPTDSMQPLIRCQLQCRLQLTSRLCRLEFFGKLHQLADFMAGDSDLHRI